MVTDSIYILSELESGVKSAYKLLGHSSCVTGLL